MKKLLLVLTILMLAPLSSFAISLAELQSNPNEYVVVSQAASSTIYVKKSSIESLRYSPPFYSMKAKTYGVNYSGDDIYEYETIANYDYDQTMEGIGKRVLHDNPGIPFDEYMKKCIAERNRDSGITCSLTDIYVWSLDGRAKGKLPSTYNQKCFAGAPMYQAANYMFYFYYEKYFGDKYDSENLY